MASVTKRGDKWQYRVTYLDNDGKKKTINKSGFRTKKTAELAAHEIELKHSRGAELDRTNVKFLDYWDKWISLYKAGKHTKITESHYFTVRKQLLAYFGADRELKTITKSNWQEFINYFAAGNDRKTARKRSNNTITKLNGYVRSMANNAIDDQIIYANFTNGVIIPKDDDQDKIKYLELDDFKKLISFVSDNADYRKFFSYYLIITGALTGARYSEILGLTWKDVDFKNKEININKTFDYRYRTGFAPTKNKSSVRVIDISDNLIKMLSQLKRQQAEAYLQQGYRDPNNMVFRNYHHLLISNEAVNKILKKAEATLKIKNPITFHGLRHTHVSFLIYKHININYISSRLGHADVTITQTVYSHLFKTLEKEQAKATTDALSSL